MTVGLGLPIQWSEAALTDVSAVTPEDMQAAYTAWQTYAPAQYQSLPLAPTEEDGQDPATEIAIGALILAASTRYVWNATLSIYVMAGSQKAISFQIIRDITDQVAQAQLSGMASLSSQLQAGNISLAEWQLGMARAIKVMHVNQAVVARGGWAQMSQSDWGWVGAKVKNQYQYLNNFADQIANGSQALDGTFEVRTGLYEGAGRGTYEEMRRRVEQLYNGMEEERRILGHADHCNGCLEQAGLGWQAIGTLDPIGAEECITRCHCRFIFRRTGSDGTYITGGE